MLECVHIHSLQRFLSSDQKVSHAVDHRSKGFKDMGSNPTELFPSSFFKFFLIRSSEEFLQCAKETLKSTITIEFSKIRTHEHYSDSIIHPNFSGKLFRKFEKNFF